MARRTGHKGRWVGVWDPLYGCPRCAKLLRGLYALFPGVAGESIAYAVTHHFWYVRYERALADMGATMAGQIELERYFGIYGNPHRYRPWLEERRDEALKWRDHYLHDLFQGPVPDEVARFMAADLGR